MNSKLLVLSILASIALVGCGKKTETKVIEVPVYTSKQESEPVVANDDEEDQQDSGTVVVPKPDVIETKANIDYKPSRKTSLKIDINNKISNFDEYIRDLNKRKIVAKNEGRALDHGVLKCNDVTNPTAVTEKTANFKNDGTIAEIEITLSGSNSGFTYECVVFENNQLLKDSESVKKKAINFYEDKLIEKPTKYNDLGLVPRVKKFLGSIVILDKGSLVTNGQALDIVAEEMLVLPGGKIQTFLENEKTAADNKDGAGGGRLDIITDFIFGELQVEMHGQNGGKKTLRPEKETRLPDYYRPGMENGVDEVSQTRWREQCRDADDCEEIQYEEVLVWAERGKDGQKGREGRAGFKGTSGGNTGSMALIANSAGEFSIDLELLAGKGGEGGLGGEGGPATPAGKMPYCRESCSGITAGNPGPKGDDGLKGEDGPKGQVQSASYVNNQNTKMNKTVNTEKAGF